MRSSTKGGALRCRRQLRLSARFIGAARGGPRVFALTTRGSLPRAPGPAPGRRWAPGPKEPPRPTSGTLHCTRHCCDGPANGLLLPLARGRERSLHNCSRFRAQSPGPAGELLRIPTRKCYGSQAPSGSHQDAENKPSGVKFSIAEGEVV